MLNRPLMQSYFHLVARLFAGLCALLMSGCGFHYFDSKNGVDHLWGFGHLRMRTLPPTNGVEAVIKGYTMVGVKVGGSQEDYGVSVGYDDRKMIFLNPTNAAFRIEWPRAGWFNIRIGTNVPFIAEPLAISPDRKTPRAQ